MTDDAKRRILASLADATRTEKRAASDKLALIYEARAAGASFREIAEAADLNHQTIANRLKEQGA